MPAADFAGRRNSIIILHHRERNRRRGERIVSFETNFGRERTPPRGSRFPPRRRPVLSCVYDDGCTTETELNTSAIVNFQSSRDLGLYSAVRVYTRRAKTTAAAAAL